MNPVIQAVTNALGQFLWQGFLIFVLLRVVLYSLRRRSPETRYLASCAALALMAVLPIITAVAIYDPWPSDHKNAAMTLTIRAVWSGSAPVLSHWLTADNPWILRVWLAGVVLLSARLVWAAGRVASLRRSGMPADARITATAMAIARRISTNRTVRVVVSSLPTGPSLAGWFRPVILLPASTILNLTSEQLEAVLAHELAHLARYDDVVNIAQSIVETLLFYHPAVWWISNRIRHERELCCDDLAIRISGDALGYASTLTALEGLRIRAPRLALGTTGGALSYRVRRIAGVATQEYSPSGLPALVLFCAALAAIGIYSAPARADLRQPRIPIEYPAAALTTGIQGTVPVEVTVNAAGTITHARARGGPAELQDAAVRSVAALRVAPGSQRIDVAFQLAAPAAPSAAQPPEKSTLEGTVLGANGKPLSKTTVWLQPAGSAERRQSLVPVVAMTDLNGQFLFEQADPGRYSIRAEHHGYVTGTLAMVQATSGQRVAGIKLGLVPTAVISGRVVDADGDPVEHVNVSGFIYRYGYTNGQRYEFSVSSARTDDHGDFQLTGLAPGKLRISFTPPENAGFGSIDDDPQPRSGRPRGKAEEGYVTTYYPGVSDADSALPLAISPGQNIAGLRITMKKIAVFHARGQVIGGPLTGRRKIGDWRVGAGMTFVPIAANGAFDIAGLRPGPHTLIVTGDDDMLILAAVPVTIAAEDAELKIDVPPAGDFAGVVRIEGSASKDVSPAGIRLHLENNVWIAEFKDETVDANGSFLFHGVRPRKYSLQLSGLPPNSYLKSATLAGRDVLSREIDLSGAIDGAPLELVVSTGAAKISGSVTVAEGEQLAGTRLILVPDTPMPERGWLYRRFSADMQGQFSADGIAPGKYRLFAVEQLDSGVEFDPDWVRIHRARSIPVTLEERDSVPLTLKRTSLAQLADDERSAGQ